MPIFCAALTFSATPPTASTLPVRDISPVIAVSALQWVPKKREVSATTIVTPAEGPSLGTEPAGKCTWMSEYMASS
eukprot:CAMPEP_0197480290 /NCGR_PEP_ID=MMETSP1309-20131121/40227_1 /TAXON_ID=464262 /ORGANISM="Genus nov. species nov., Strain RCC998" /LENGTH=75 /DNA_ID=CAMNT_0043022215 /DNA_START=234 /DNA_END=461 /DNA_ORIENTATION=+